jgi:hypothetical protein
MDVVDAALDALMKPEEAVFLLMDDAACRTDTIRRGEVPMSFAWRAAIRAIKEGK